MFASLLALQIFAASAPSDPFAFFQPSVTISADERIALDRGEPVARVLPGQGLEVAVVAAVPVDVDGDRLVAWMREIAAMKKSRYVLAIGRFSDPPAIDDLAALSLEDSELSDLRQCHPQHCGLKLSSAEMDELQRTAGAAGAGWKDALQQEFRRLVLARVTAYLTTGAIAPYEDERRIVYPAERFDALLDHSVFLQQHVPEFVNALRRYPEGALPDVESFLYWSKERLAGKPIVSITHVNILRSHAPGFPDAIVAGKEIFSTHYVNASLGLTSIVRGTADGPNYLVYINRSEVDTLGGMFGGLVRFFMQRRLRSEAGAVLDGLRHRLESGPPSS